MLFVLADLFHTALVWQQRCADHENGCEEHDRTTVKRSSERTCEVVVVDVVQAGNVEVVALYTADDAVGSVAAVVAGMVAAWVAVVADGIAVVVAIGRGDDTGRVVDIVSVVVGVYAVAAVLDDRTAA